MNEDEIERNFINECEEDYVGLWSIVRDVREVYPNWSDEIIRIYTLSLLERLLEKGNILVGVPDEEATFVAWKLLPRECILRLESGWRALGRAPDIGEIAWFTSAL